MRAYVFQDGNPLPIALTIKTCRILFDVWDEVYRISISQAGLARMDTAAPNLEGVSRRCGSVRNFGLVDRSVLQPWTSYYVAVVVDVDPTWPSFWPWVDQWIANPTGPMIPFNTPTSSRSQMAFRTASFVP
ncbi:MAG: hypothetical protein HY898_22970 [Deltaproteobacteria bacterium]|nr:hypothetical protein [Deltaproteobacteria bacterium]